MLEWTRRRNRADYKDQDSSRDLPCTLLLSCGRNFSRPTRQIALSLFICCADSDVRIGSGSLGPTGMPTGPSGPPESFHPATAVSAIHAINQDLTTEFLIGPAQEEPLQVSIAILAWRTVSPNLGGPNPNRPGPPDGFSSQRFGGQPAIPEPIRGPTFHNPFAITPAGTRNQLIPGRPRAVELCRSVDPVDPVGKTCIEYPHRGNVAELQQQIDRRLAGDHSLDGLMTAVIRI